MVKLFVSLARTGICARDRVGGESLKAPLVLQTACRSNFYAPEMQENGILKNRALRSSRGSPPLAHCRPVYAV
jgi:hypothetical protein